MRSGARPGKVRAGPPITWSVMRPDRLLILIVSVVYAAGPTACTGSPVPPVFSQASPGASAATSGDLLYVASTGGNVFLFAYPSGGFAGEFTIASGVTAWGACADRAGNVFITVDVGSTSSEIYEYAHDGTTPTAILSNDGYVALDCASDPTTGNLAVVSADASGKSDIAIYADARGTPNRYYHSNMNFESCSYDGHGNLFADGSGMDQLTELAAGAKTFKVVPLNEDLIRPGGIVWDGQDLAIKYGGFYPKNSGIARVEIADGKAKVASNIGLKGLANTGATFAIEDGALLDTGGQAIDQVGVWNYPAGGKVTKILRARHAKGQTFYGIALSVASHR